MSHIGVAIVGTGFGATVHIPGFRENNRTEVVALYHRNLEKARSLALKYEVQNYFDQLEELLSLETVDAVALSTPPFLHYEMAKQIMLSGKHLLLEKPLTMTFAECQHLYHIAQSQGVIVAVDFMFRTIPAWQLLEKYLNQGYIGKPRFIKVDWLVPGRADPLRPWNWYSSKEQGGGALGALGSHVFDYLHWLFGPASSISAQLYSSIQERIDPLDGLKKVVDADDIATISLQLGDQVPAQVNLSSSTYQGRGHWLEIYGDQGTLVLGSSNLKDYVHGFQLMGSSKGAELKKIDIPQELDFKNVFADGRIAPFARVADIWATAIDSGNQPVPSLTEGLYCQLLMDLAHQSNEQRKSLEIPSTWL